MGFHMVHSQKPSSVSVVERRKKELREFERGREGEGRKSERCEGEKREGEVRGRKIRKRDGENYKNSCQGVCPLTHSPIILSLFLGIQHFTEWCLSNTSSSQCVEEGAMLLPCRTKEKSERKERVNMSSTQHTCTSTHTL